MKEKYLNLRYILLQWMYWGGFCALGGYAVVYFDEKGFSAGQAGLIMALTNVVAAILQPFIAEKADRSGKISLREIMLIIVGITVIPLLFLIVSGNSFWLIAALFLIAYASWQLLQPLNNAVGMYYQDHGGNINYGMARGLGSVSYAAASSLLGILIQKMGVVAVPILAVLLALIYIPITFSFHMSHEKIEKEEIHTERVMELLKQNKKFSILLLGIICMFIFHFMTNTYMFQMVEAVGGDSENLGIAVAIAAICEIPVMFAFSKLVAKFKIETLLRFAAIGWLIKALGFCLCTNVMGIYIVQVFQMIAFGLYIPASVYYADKIMKPENKVKGQAMVTMAFTIGSVFGNLLGGRIIDRSGIQMMLMVGVFFAVVGVILFILGTKEKLTD